MTQRVVNFTHKAAKKSFPGYDSARNGRKFFPLPIRPVVSMDAFSKCQTRKRHFFDKAGHCAVDSRTRQRKPEPDRRDGRLDSRSTSARAIWAKVDFAGDEYAPLTRNLMPVSPAFR